MKHFFPIIRFLVLRSVVIAAVLMSGTNASADVISDPTEGRICDGVAGVECPVGYTCEYFQTESTDAQGVCQKIKEPLQPGPPALSGPPPVPNPAGHPLGIHCPPGTTWGYETCMPLPEPQGGYIGIPSAQMNYVAAAQRNSQWCWAAAIQMVLNYYGVNILQEQIVARTYGTDPYGRLPDWAGRLDAVTTNLNNWSIDNAGRTYVVQSTLNWGAPSPTVLLQELQQGSPVIISYLSSPTTAHAVVISGAKVIQSPTGPILQSVIVRDPWPSSQNVATRGRIEYPSAQIVPFMQAYWYVRVY